MILHQKMQSSVACACETHGLGLVRLAGGHRHQEEERQEEEGGNVGGLHVGRAGRPLS